MDVQVRVLGPIEVLVDDRAVELGGPKQRMVVALLAQEVGRRVSTDALLAGLYGDEPPGGGRRTLQTYVSKLRRGIGDALHSVSGGYVLDVPAEEVDAVRFEAAYRSAVGRLEDDPAAAGELLRDALSWWRGHAYADVDAEGPIIAEVTRLHELRLAAIEARLDADLALGLHDEVLGELEALTAQHPLRERLHGQRMLALYRAGRQADALSAYGAIRGRLVEQLGLDPSRELRELEERILAQDPDLRVEQRRVARRAVVVTDLDPDHWDDADARVRLDRRDAVLATVASREGTRIEVHGSAVVISLPDIGEAVDVAASLARDAAGLRIAVDHGDVEEDGAGDVSGPPVTRAARVLALGHPGQVLLTAPAQGALTTSGQAGRTLTSLGTHEVSGLGDPVPLFQLEALGLPGPFPPLRAGHLPPPIPVPVGGSLPGYELRRPLRVGPVGSLHLAYQPAVGREVEAFVVEPAAVGSAAFTRRFEVEAQRLARSSHPHAVDLLDFWRTPEQAALVFRHVPGTGLDEVVAAGPLPRRDVATLLEQVADALDHAHERGIVHGAVGAATVRLDERGSARLAELGIRHVCATVPGAWLHDHAAPEVLAGDRPTSRTDVHGLAMLAHHLLTGAPPPPDGPLPSVGGAIDECLADLTAPDPSARPASAGDAAALLREALGLSAPARRRVATRNPYRGLEPFTELDAPDFHGRHRLVEEVVDALRERAVVTAVGPSGVGKSSLVRAGVVPAVRSGAAGAGTWLVTDCTPGDRPLQRLATALRRVAYRSVDGLDGLLDDAAPDGLGRAARAVLPDGARLLLVVDQFEELFTGTAPDAARARLLAMLCDLDPTGPVRVVLTLRADVFDRPLEHARFGAVMRAALVPVHAPDGDELAEIVQAPAAGVGVVVEPGLVARIVADAGQQPGSLPLVEHLLTELFEARDPEAGALRLDDYLSAGGVHGAIGRRAERVHDGLDDDQRPLVRDLLLQLVAVDEEGAVGRRRVERPALVGVGADREAAQSVVDRFASSRLLTLDADPTTRVPTVELAHEALVREWDRLADWIEQAHADLLARHRLEAIAAAWVAGGRDDADLLRGGRLLAAEERIAMTAERVPDEVRALVAVSRERADAEAERIRRRRRRTTGALVGALVVSLAFGGIAVDQRSDADAARTQAEREATRAEVEATRAGETATVAQARFLATESGLVVGSDPDRAVLLALGAIELSRSVDDDVLVEARSALEVAARSVRVLGRTSTAAVWLEGSAGGRLAMHEEYVEAGPGGGSGAEIEIRTLDGVLETVLSVPGIPWQAVWLGEDRLVVSLDLNLDPSTPRAVIVDVDSGAVVGELREGPSDAPSEVQTSTDGRLVALTTIVDPSSVRTTVWDAVTGEVVFETVPGTVALPTGSGERLLLWDGSAMSYLDVATGERSDAVPLADTPLVERDGRVLVDTGGGVAVVDTTSGLELGRIDVPSPTAGRLWGPDRVVLGSNTGTVHVLDLTTGVEDVVAVTRGTAFGLSGVPSRDELAVTTLDGQLLLVATSPGRASDAAVPVDDTFRLHAAPSGGLLVVEGRTTATRIDTVERRVVDVADPGAVLLLAQRVASSLDGRVLAWVDADLVGHLTVEGEPVPLGPCESVRSIDGAGRFVVVDTGMLRETCSTRGPSHVLDVRTGDRVAEFTEPGLDGELPGVVTAEFGVPGEASGDLVAVNVDRDRLEVWDLARRERVLRFDPDQEPYTVLGAALSPDGDTAVIGSQTGFVTVVDLAAVRTDGAFDEDRHTRQVFGGDGGVALGLDVDDQSLAIGAGSTRAALLDLETLEPVVSVPTDPGARVAVAVHDGGFWYADRGVVRRVPIDLDDQVAEARSRLTRGWRVEECEEYGIEDCWTDPPSADGDR